MDQYWEVQKVIPNQETKEVINEFLLNLKIANRSENTITMYRSFLERFFADHNVSFTELTSDDIQNWFNNHSKTISKVSLSPRLSILSSFYKFCVNEEYVEKSPMKTRWFPRLPKPIPKYLEKGDIAKSKMQTEKRSLRDQLLIEFMLDSGCRIGEVQPLNKEDIDLENRTARVTGKGKKIRNVHFTEKCALLFEKHFESLPHVVSAVFVNSEGTRLSKRGMQYIINVIGEDGGLSTHLHAHKLRHTFATELLAKGAELSFIGDELGHTSLETTRVYASLPKRELISLYRKYMG